MLDLPPLSTGRFPIYLGGGQFTCLVSFRICLHWQPQYICPNKYPPTFQICVKVLQIYDPLKPLLNLFTPLGFLVRVRNSRPTYPSATEPFFHSDWKKFGFHFHLKRISHKTAAYLIGIVGEICKLKEQNSENAEVRIIAFFSYLKPGLIVVLNFWRSPCSTFAPAVADSPFIRP